MNWIPSREDKICLLDFVKKSCLLKAYKYTKTSGYRQTPTRNAHPCLAVGEVVFQLDALKAFPIGLIFS